MRIHNDLRKVVVFVGHGTHNNFNPIGTAFFVEYDKVRYLVTAKHIANVLGDDPYDIRVNKVDGTSDEFHMDGDIEWFTHTDLSVDLAVAPFHRNLRAAGFDVMQIPMEKDLQVPDIEIGDPAYTVGLFRFLQGKKRNLPIVHTGSVAMLPGEERIPVALWDHQNPTTERKLVEGYLVESVGVNGLSGSPVFTRPPIQIEVEISHGKTAWATAVSMNVVFVGVWQAAWNARPDEVAAVNMGANVTVPVGIGVVIPKIKIFEILERPEMTVNRAELQKREKEENEARLAASLQSASASPASDENPTHQEDFTSLLSAAVKKPQPDA